MKVLVTGGASGLGAALARNARRAVTLCMCWTWRRGRAFFTPMTWPAAIPPRGPRWQIGLAAHGPFDLVMLSAGISATGRFEAIPLSDHHKVTAVNLAGAIRLRAPAAGQRAAPGARLVFVASLSCFTGYPGAASYAASKDGLAGFARSLRKPLAQTRHDGATRLPRPDGHTPRHPLRARRGQRQGAACAGARGPRYPARRGFTIIPGAGPKLAGLAGRLAPQAMTRLMGRVLFSKLK